MKLTRVSAIGAGFLALALALAGCSAGGGGESDEIQEGTTITAVQNQPFNCINGLTSDCNSTYNSNINYMLSAAFNYYDDTPELKLNEDFGTYEKVSDDPLTIKYTIADGVKWSDGAAVDASDMLLAWASSISKYNDPDGAVNFSSALAGTPIDLVTKVPEISDDGRSLTLIYDTPYVDWETNFAVNMPAHINYELAFPDVTDADKAKDALIKAIQDDDTDTLAKVAEQWNTAWNLTEMPTDKKLLVSNGAYVMSDYEADQYVTLTANPDYAWGPKPKVDTITVRFVSDPTAQVQALENGEVSLIYGQATADTVQALNGLDGTTTTTTATATYEHLDLTFNNGGPFDPATYGGDADKAKLVREAFLKVVPRQGIIDNLIDPILEGATTDDSQVLLPGAAGYDESVAGNGSDEYAEADVPAAQALLAEAGVTGPIDVTLMYGKSNTRRASEFQLIKASADQAGFNVIDGGDDDWSEKLGDGTYDAALFAWAFGSLAVTGGQSNFASDGGSNYSGYNNPEVDSLYDQLGAEFDADKQLELLAQIDAALWGDAYGVTLFQHPDVAAWSDSVSNVSEAPLIPNIFWNFWEWETTDKADDSEG